MRGFQASSKGEGAATPRRPLVVLCLFWRGPIDPRLGEIRRVRVTSWLLVQSPLFPWLCAALCLAFTSRTYTGFSSSHWE